MERAVKKCYKLLDLPYNSTEEEVFARKTFLINRIRAKSLKSGKINEEKLKKINLASEKIIFNIKKFGVPSKACQTFKTDIGDLVNLFFAFCFTLLFCAVSIYVIL